MRRRTFLKCASICALDAGAIAASAAQKQSSDIVAAIDAHRPTRLTKTNFRDRVGATHVAGKYHLTSKPFLIEGAEKLIELGTRVGKFWFMPSGAARDYPFNSTWPKCATLADLARTEYFQKVFALPFTTIILEAHATRENGWRQQHNAPFYSALSDEFYELASFLFERYSGRDITFILQHWEGDWLLRGKAGQKWDTPPPDWRSLCQRMQQWLAARQAGVSRAQDQFAGRSRCRVFHAAEVNRVTDVWKNIPTVTRDVLPHVPLDMVSYSAYDGLKDGPTLWRCVQEIKASIRRTTHSPAHNVYLGEVGIPENEQPARIVEKWDEWLGVALALELPYVVHWELYCNELNPKITPPPKAPVTSNRDVRGFWLVRPDGSLSDSGKLLSSLWHRTG